MPGHRAQLEAGRAAFNRGEFYLAHELWEDLWHELVGADRLLVQGLIQVAAGLHHLQGGRAEPAARLLRKGVDKLAAGASGLLADLPLDTFVPRVVELATALEARRSSGASVSAPLDLRL